MCAECLTTKNNPDWSPNFFVEGRGSGAVRVYSKKSFNCSNSPDDAKRTTNVGGWTITHAIFQLCQLPQNSNYKIFP